MRERLAGTAIKSITQPLLVLTIAITLPTMVAAHFLTGIALYFDLALAVLFPILFAVTHVYFMFTEPNRLQSEDFRLRDRTLSLLETNFGVISDPRLIEPSDNPLAVGPAKGIALTSSSSSETSTAGEEKKSNPSKEQPE